MIAFVVNVNGRKCCTIGVGKKGVLSAHLTWVVDLPKVNDLFFHAGGLVSSRNEHLGWPVPEIKVGDKVQISVIETERIDKPYRREVSKDKRPKTRKTKLTKLRSRQKRHPA